MSEDLLFSSDASATRYLFYQGLNEINLFVEDVGSEYEYETIFKRLLGNSYSIATIFAVGGKPKVIASFYEFGEFSGKIGNFYLVDGDFDRFLRPAEMVNNSHFIYLQRYNIESYLIDKSACERFAKGKLKCLDIDLVQRIKFDLWKNQIISQSTKLFFCYCYIQKHFPQRENLNRSPYKFIDSKTGFERIDGAYMQYWNDLHDIDSDIESKINCIKEDYEAIYGQDYTNLICGKFLLTSLYCYLRSIFPRPFTTDDLRWYLVEHFDVSCLNFVKEAILANYTAT